MHTIWNMYMYMVDLPLDVHQLLEADTELMGHRGQVVCLLQQSLVYCFLHHWPPRTHDAASLRGVRVQRSKCI